MHMWYTHTTLPVLNNLQTTSSNRTSGTTPEQWPWQPIVKLHLGQSTTKWRHGLPEVILVANQRIGCTHTLLL